MRLLLVHAMCQALRPGVDLGVSVPALDDGRSGRHCVGNLHTTSKVPVFAPMIYRGREIRPTRKQEYIMARARKESQRMDREPTADPSRYTAKELRSEIARIKRETRALAQQVEH